jgi:hypothetical protein
MGFIDHFDLKTTAYVKRIAYVSDGMGGNTQTTSTVDIIKCAFWLTGSYEKYISDRTHNPGTYTLVCAPSTKYLASDKVIIRNSTYTINQPDNVLQNDDVMVIGLELKG